MYLNTQKDGAIVIKKKSFYSDYFHLLWVLLILQIPIPACHPSSTCLPSLTLGNIPSLFLKLGVAIWHNPSHWVINRSHTAATGNFCLFWWGLHIAQDPTQLTPQLFLSSLNTGIRSGSAAAIVQSCNYKSACQGQYREKNWIGLGPYWRKSKR